MVPLFDDETGLLRAQILASRKLSESEAAHPKISPLITQGHEKRTWTFRCPEDGTRPWQFKGTFHRVFTGAPIPDVGMGSTFFGTTPTIRNVHEGRCSLIPSKSGFEHVLSIFTKGILNGVFDIADEVVNRRRRRGGGKNGGSGAKNAAGSSGDPAPAEATTPVPPEGDVNGPRVFLAGGAVLACLQLWDNKGLDPLYAKCFEIAALDKMVATCPAQMMDVVPSIGEFLTGRKLGRAAAEKDAQYHSRKAALVHEIRMLYQYVPAALAGNPQSAHAKEQTQNLARKLLRLRKLNERAKILRERGERGGGGVGLLDGGVVAGGPGAGGGAAAEGSGAEEESFGHTGSPG